MLSYANLLIRLERGYKEMHGVVDVHMGPYPHNFLEILDFLLNEVTHGV